VRKRDLVTSPQTDRSVKKEGSLTILTTKRRRCRRETETETERERERHWPRERDRH